MIINNSNFDLKQIAESGQCFRWKKIFENAYLVPAFGKCLIIVKNNDSIILSCDEEEFNSIWKDYFDLDRDYSKIGKKILKSNDNHLKDSYKLGSGIRILKQDLWEMIFSFMISQNNNIKRISKSIELICEKVSKSSVFSLSDSFFEELNMIGLQSEQIDLIVNLINDNNIFSFPDAKDISPDIFDDSSLGLGYRAPYLKGLCEFVVSNPLWMDNLRLLNYDDAIKNLISIKGIGIKVANCVCLFGLNHLESFPVDTHVKQLLEKYYPDGIDLSLYDGEAGIIQQYLFYYELKK